jgi:hypothetical protein
MKVFLNKIKSRKFLTCVAGVVMGACMVFGVDVDSVDTISGAIVAVFSVVTYIYTEGKVDAAAVKDAAGQVNDAIDSVEKIEE